MRRKMKLYIDSFMRDRVFEILNNEDIHVTGMDISFFKGDNKVGGWQIDLYHPQEFRVDKWGTTK